MRNHPGSHFRQTTDIDLSDYEENEGWEPIGDSRGWHDSMAFTGTYDGGGHRIVNLTIDHLERYYVGLFGYMGSDAALKNITLENIAVSGARTTGGIVGYNAGGVVTGCRAA